MEKGKKTSEREKERKKTFHDRIRNFVEDV